MFSYDQYDPNAIAYTRYYTTRYMLSMKSIEEKFWAKVKKSDGCWLWIGAKNPAGYGTITKHYGKNFYAHRLSYQLRHGNIPLGMLVCHICDNPSCVNPDHLFLGTDKDNKRDMINKKRSASGEKNFHSKLTTCEVVNIREEYSKGIIGIRPLAKKYNVSYTTVQRILKGYAWKTELTPRNDDQNQYMVWLGVE